MSDTIIFEILFFTLSFISIIYTIRSYRESKNPVDIALIAFTISIILQSIIRFALEMNLSIDFTIGALFNIHNIGVLVYVCLQIEFLLYLKDKKKLYTLPLVISFYMAAGLILYDNGLALYVFALGSGIITSILLAKEGAKNRNGLALSIAVFIIINGSTQTIELLMFNIIYIGPVLRLIAVFIMLLGTSGFINKYILIDKEQEEKVTNIWISRVVTEGNK